MSTKVEFYIPENTREEIKTILSDYFSEEKVEQVEEGVFLYSKQYCQLNNCFQLSSAIYMDVSKNLKFNLEQNGESIQKIIHQIECGQMNPCNLAFLKNEELDEAKWKTILLRKKNTEEKLNYKATITWRPCKQCKSTKYEFYQMQTRSADEPVTTYYTCHQCSRKYMVNN